MSAERRVVVTGMGGVTALGDSWPAVQARLDTFLVQNPINLSDAVNGLACPLASTNPTAAPS